MDESVSGMRHLKQLRHEGHESTYDTRARKARGTWSTRARKVPAILSTRARKIGDKWGTRALNARETREHVGHETRRAFNWADSFLCAMRFVIYTLLFDKYYSICIFEN